MKLYLLVIIWQSSVVKTKLLTLGCKANWLLKLIVNKLFKSSGFRLRIMRRKASVKTPFSAAARVVYSRFLLSHVMIFPLLFFIEPIRRRAGDINLGKEAR